MHYPVLRAEALEYLAIRPEGVYLDATAGMGGHTREIAARLTTGLDGSPAGAVPAADASELVCGLHTSAVCGSLSWIHWIWKPVTV